MTKKQDVRLPTGQSQYMVVGRFVPNAKYSEESPMCKVYRMKLFAKNKVVARSRFWYFMGRLCRVKKANGQIISVNQVMGACHSHTVLYVLMSTVISIWFRGMLRPFRWAFLSLHPASPNVRFWGA